MLKLVTIEETDLETLMHWRMLSEVTKYMYTEPQLTMDMQKKWFHSINKDPMCKHWIIEHETIKIGIVNLTEIDFKNSRCSWGHYIANTSLRGKGIGRLLEYNIYDYVLLELSLNKLMAEVLDFNENAINLHKKCGSQIEGVLRQYIKKGNKYYDVVVLGILRDEWLERRGNLDYAKISIESC
ncbi:MAG: UDP-4-amino-4,6-dideoxy-N-acetyl-beta-L-altrosamine N-acetyltransferase [Desulfosporosinus sp.]|nr:UDP-4-amino-4,6-dideoxy-N-acetyl-beta-L-altrosamine N-acetyltransferase [Desulfosporosinus sp.]